MNPTPRHDSCSLGGDGLIFLDRRFVFPGKRMDGIECVLGSFDDETSNERLGSCSRSFEARTSLLQKFCISLHPLAALFKEA